MNTIKINNIEWEEIIMSKNIQIKNRYTDEVIFECEGSIKEAVEKAVREKANLREADLIRADLWGANLREADLIRADLREANLSGADLIRANLREANLSGANLREANLREADLIRADLSGADLWGADLSGANLIRADLNAIFYKTKITLKQRKYIAEESDLFSVVGDSSSFSEKELRK